MRILVDTTNCPMPTKVQAALARGILGAVVAVNRVLLRMAIKSGRPYPALYQSEVEYRSEPWRGFTIFDDETEYTVKQIDEFANVRTVFARGWGDCDDLTAWRLAELNEQGVMAEPRIYWRYFLRDPKTGRLGKRLNLAEFEHARANKIPTATVMHCEVRHPKLPGEVRGKVEDPSRNLGL